jgi:hypothetical protein
MESHCDVCSTEKWGNAKFCWNEGCPISPVYYKLTGAGRDDISSSTASIVCNTDDSSSSWDGSAENVVATAAVAAVRATSSQKHSVAMEVVGQSDTSSGTSSHQQLQFSDLSIGLMHNGPQLNNVNDYMLQLPTRIVGASTGRSGLTSAFSSQAMLSSSSAAAGGIAAGGSSLVQCGQVLYMAPVQSNKRDLVDLTSAPVSAAAGTTSVMYTQYYYSKKSDRSDSFAGGETDSEVAPSPVTVPANSYSYGNGSNSSSSGTRGASASPSDANANAGTVAIAATADTSIMV